MAHEEKKNKNSKKVATKAAKVHGTPKIPKYELHESSSMSADLTPKARKK